MTRRGLSIVWLALSLSFSACPALGGERSSALHSCSIAFPDSWHVTTHEERYGQWLIGEREDSGGNIEVVVVPASQFGTTLNAAFVAKFEKWAIKPRYVKVRGEYLSHNGLACYEVEGSDRIGSMEVSGIVRVLLVGNKAYVLSSGVRKDDPVAQQERSAIFASFTVGPATSAAATPTPPYAAWKEDRTLHQISKMVGACAVLILIGVWLYTRKRRGATGK